MSSIDGALRAHADGDLGAEAAAGLLIAGALAGPGRLRRLHHHGGQPGQR